MSKALIVIQWYKGAKRIGRTRAIKRSVAVELVRHLLNTEATWITVHPQNNAVRPKR